MSDEYDDDVYDKYESGGNTDVAPVVSWKFAKDGDGFTGILLPAKPLDRPDKGYEIRREFKQPNKATNDPGGFTRWPPRGNKQKIKTPVTEAKFAELWPDEDVEKAKKVWQPHFTFETGITNGEFISAKTADRMKEADQDPNAETRRRIIEQGKSLTDEIAAALKKVGGKPLPGQTWYVGLKTRVPNDYDGETRIHEVRITPPTAESKAVVEKYIADAKAKAGAEADAADPDDKYAGASQEDPPF